MIDPITRLFWRIHLTVTRLIFRLTTPDKTFSLIEKLLRKIPTWLFVTGAIVFLASIALWVEADSIKSFRDIIKILFERADSIAIIIGVILFIKELPNRKIKKHYEARQIIDNASANRVVNSYARIQALQDLNQDGVPLRDLDLSRSNLSKISLSSADLSGSNLNQSNLFQADLSGANLTYCELNDSNLGGANLTKANLRYSNFCRADFNGCQLDGTDFEASDLSHATFPYAKSYSTAFYDAANFQYAKLCHADMNTSLFDRGNFCKADLSHANCWRTILQNANFYSATLVEVDFRGAQLQNSTFLEANLTGADLRWAKLDGVNFSKADLNNVNFSEAEFGNADFSEAIGLTEEQVRAASDWGRATYSEDLCRQLGLRQQASNSNAAED